MTELARHVDPNHVLISCTNPGLTSGTGFDTNTGNFALNGILGLVTRRIGRTVVVGASAYIDAVVVQGNDNHGGFASDWTLKP